MRVVFSLLQALKPKAGVGHYAARLFAALQKTLPPDSLDGFPSGAVARLVRRVQRSRSGGGPPHLGMSNRAGLIMRDALRAVGRGGLGLAFRATCQRGDYDLYHEPNFIPMPGGPPAVVTVHDLSVILHPEWHPADRVRDHERRFCHGLDSARHILADTHAGRREIIEHLGVRPDRVTAIHLGVGSEYFDVPGNEVSRVRRELALPIRYLLFVGTIEPRKNIGTVLKAYCDLPRDLRESCPLVLAGGWGWKAADVAEMVRTDAAAKGVVHLGYVTDGNLPGLYAGARALVYPSHYEGFGLPPLEMLATGGAVLSSTASALREVLADHAHFVEPLDVAGWRASLARAISDDDWLADVRKGGRALAATFTWERCAAETVAVYRSLLVPVRQAA